MYILSISVPQPFGTSASHFNCMPETLMLYLQTGAKDSSAAGAAPAGAKPGRTECEQGRKWVVENHVNNPEIVISETNSKQAVYIYGCKGCTVQACCALVHEGCSGSTSPARKPCTYCDQHSALLSSLHLQAQQGPTCSACRPNS